MPDGAADHRLDEVEQPVDLEILDEFATSASSEGCASGRRR
jgi:hypothetical protein